MSIRSKIEDLLTGKFLTWVNQLRLCGPFRFNINRFIFRCLPCYPVTRNEKWDFILGYLPYLSFMYNIGKLKVLIVGCTSSLLVYEIARRRYLTYGLDIRPYQEKLPNSIGFFQVDITKPLEINGGSFDFIVATSVIELVEGDGADRKAVENVHKMLNNEGYFILTLPTTYWKSMTARGYTLNSFRKLIEGLFDIYELTQRGGYLCAVLVKSQ